MPGHGQTSDLFFFVLILNLLMIMNQTTPMPVFTTKNVDEVPFKNELYSKDCSQELLRAVSKKKYREFIRDCKNPDHLLEVLLIKHTDAHFPNLVQITRIANRANFLGSLLSFVAGSKLGNELKCAIYRNHIPKNQYGTV